MIADLMHLLDLTLPTPAENLALEESLLQWGEQTGQECLRLWESPDYFVVLGAGSPSRTDVNVDACREAGVPILRRCSGGGTVVQGPGCLNYALVLDMERDAALKSISGTN
jgi:lipoate-protein ligase A